MEFAFIDNDLLITDESGDWLIPSYNIKKWCLAYVREYNGKNISIIYKILREIHKND